MAQLRVLRGRPSPTVTIERHRVVGAAMDAKALADDLENVLGAIEQRMWAGNRAGAVNEIGRAYHRIEELRDAFLELAGIADTAPTDPATAVRSVA